jgi:hypothetical protein
LLGSESCYTERTCGRRIGIFNITLGYPVV